MNPAMDGASELIEMGIQALPLKPHSKIPATRHGKKDASSDPAQIAEWFKPGTSLNVGALTGERSGIIVVDVDPRNDGEASFERMERAYGKLPNTKRANTGGGGFHLYYRVPAGTSGLGDRPNAAGFRGVDIKADGYVVAPPSIHPNGKPYEWLGDTPISPAPDWLVGVARGEKRIKPAPTSPAAATVLEGSRNDTLFRMGSGLRAKGFSSEVILAALRAENATKYSPPLSEDEVELIAESVMRYEPSTQYPETELGNARRLVGLVNGDARYEPVSRSWFVWDGRRWSRDEEGQIVRLAKRVVDDLLAEAKLVNDPETLKRRVSFAHKSQSAARISAMIELAKTEPGVSITFDAFDRQLHTLNVANGMVDLRTGVLLPHDREAFASHIVEVAYDPSAGAPVFDRFVADVFEDDAELIEYVQRAAGYAATGETREQCFFVLHGEGANGKSTLLNALRGVLGPYAKHTPTETLVAKQGSASNDLARLAGARLVTASEANADQRLADALLKQITGDEPIVCRFLFKEFISFYPTFKLFLATNQLPQVNGSDPAMWRRIRTVPFNRVFTAEQQDRELSAKLMSEQEGILAWIVRGAVKWYEDGLITPAAVQAANAEYRAEMDGVGQFVEEKCTIAAGCAVSASALYNGYRVHANDNGRDPVSPTMFGKTLSTRGFSVEKRGGVKFRIGLNFKSMV